MIDLYGDAAFRGEQLTVLRRALLMARSSIRDQPEHWPVNVGTSSMPNAALPKPPQFVWKEVEKTKVLDLLDRMITIIDRASRMGGTVLCIGD
jgi:hypothetical protein